MVFGGQPAFLPELGKKWTCHKLRFFWALGKVFVWGQGGIGLCQDTGRESRLTPSTQEAEAGREPFWVILGYKESYKAWVIKPKSS